MKFLSVELELLGTVTWIRRLVLRVKQMMSKM